MNSKWFGDSFDLVKRVLLEVVANSGLEVYADQMFTDSVSEVEKHFFKLINAKPVTEGITSNKYHCLFLDPDTGLSGRKTKKHVTFNELYEKCSSGWNLIVVYDQSFSRTINFKESIGKKLSTLNQIGISGFYYNSHANFLFTSTNKEILDNVKRNLLGIGIPSNRLIG